VQAARTGEQQFRRSEGDEAAEQQHTPSCNQDGDDAEGAEDRRTVSHRPQR
jgi:hypothetical protein